MSRTIEQDRARAAWAAVSALTPALTEKQRQKYESLVKGAPVDIHTGGLGQTVAFYMSRDAGKNPEYDLLLRHLAAWVLPLPKSTRPDPTKTTADLMQAIHDGDTSSYRRHTAEALAYLAWLKNFAAALAPPKEEAPVESPS